MSFQHCSASDDTFPLVLYSSFSKLEFFCHTAAGAVVSRHVSRCVKLPPSGFVPFKKDFYLYSFSWHVFSSVGVGEHCLGSCFVLFLLLSIILE